MTVSTFGSFRQDITSTTDAMVGAFQIWADANNNCAIDAGEQAIEGGKGIVSPNDTFAVFSHDCTTSPNASGFAVDGFTLRLDVQ